MSRIPFRQKRSQAAGEVKDQDREADDMAIETTHDLYGSEAASAVAFCALDAWFDGEEAEFRRLAGLFRRLKN